MTVYQLRNGLSIDLTFNTPLILNPGPAKLDFKPDSPYDSLLDAYPFPIDQHGSPIPSTQVVKMTATGLLTAPPQVFNNCSLRFIQLITVQQFEVIYLGKRREEGSVTWAWSGELLQRNIDCWLSQDGSQNSSPFQFTPDKSLHLPPNKLQGELVDTPGAKLRLAEFNKESKKQNYLRFFRDRRSFESIITFVHPDGSTQMLESWKWSFTRLVALKWVKLKPEIDTNQIVFTKDNALKPVFGKDGDYAGTLSSGRIANRLSRAAMDRPQGNPNVTYRADEEANQLVSFEKFWLP